MNYRATDRNMIVAAEPPVSNARLAIILFIVSEVMLFVGLISGYVVLRYGSGQFMGMPELPIGFTAVSTPILIASSLALIAAHRALQRNAVSRVQLASVVALGLGVGFVVLQGVEWNSLIARDLIPASSVASGMFYLLSGVHGAHVVGGLVLLTILCVKAYRGTVSRSKSTMMAVASIYWHFVTLLWLTLFVMLFLL